MHAPKRVSFGFWLVMLKWWYFDLDAYWIRELIYIETTLPSTAWLKSNVVEDEIVTKSLTNDFLPKQTKSEDEDDDDESVINHPYAVELRKLLDILQTLCIQAKQVLEQELDLEKTLKQLLNRKRSRDSSRSDIDKFLRVQTWLTFAK